MTSTLRKFPLFLLAGLLFILIANVANAQFEDGSLVGTIHDSSGAIISGATVTAINAGTGIAARTTSTSTGDYEFPSLRVGVYTVKAGQWILHRRRGKYQCFGRRAHSHRSSI
jgi:hypothetical protein